MSIPTCYRCGSQPCTCADGITLYYGDCLEVLRAMPAGVVQCVVTSPPYFALRSYLDKDDPLKVKEIGSEPTPEEFVSTMIEVFREVRRVLRDDGVCFVNLGDSYSSETKHGGMSSGKHNRNGAQVPRAKRYDGQPLGNLLNIPHRVAEALRADGWIWRQTIVWAKRSPMPESVNGWRWVRCRVKVAPSVRGRNKHAGGFGQPPQGHRDGAAFSSQSKWVDCPGCPKCEPHGGYILRRGSGRCTTAHEYVFVFAKSQRYFWDGEASKERSVAGHPSGNGFKRDGRLSYGDRGQEQLWDGTQRNPRSVWTLSSEPTSERHFATFPSELVRRCLVAGVSAGGCCPHCGAPWAPVVASDRIATRPGLANKIWKHDDGDKIGQRSTDSPNLDPQRHIAVTKTLGYRQTCDCPKHEPIGCLVFDPFSGIGTTGQTARHLGCRYVGIDLNSKYLYVAARRIMEPPRWWLRKQKPKSTRKRRSVGKCQRTLFV